MKKILIFALLALVALGLVSPAFAAGNDSVRYGLYDDHFIYEGVSYPYEKPATDFAPAYMYSDGEKLHIGFRKANSSPYVTVAGDGKLTYYDSTAPTRLVYTIVDNSLSFYRSTSSNRLDAPSADVDSFSAGFIVSLFDIKCSASFNSGALFKALTPEIYYPSVPDAPDYDGSITDIFSSLFEGISFIFQSTPFLYLFGILILAFVILFIKLIFRH